MTPPQPSKAPRTDDIVAKSLEESDGEAMTEDLLIHARQLETELTEAKAQVEETTKAYKTVKAWAHRLDGTLNTILAECDDNADGAPDATGIGAFANGLLGLANDLQLGSQFSLKHQLTSLHELNAELYTHLKLILNTTATTDKNFRMENHSAAHEVIKEYEAVQVGKE